MTLSLQPQMCKLFLNCFPELLYRRRPGADPGLSTAGGRGRRRARSACRFWALWRLRVCPARLLPGTRWRTSRDDTWQGSTPADRKTARPG